MIYSKKKRKRLRHFSKDDAAPFKLKKDLEYYHAKLSPDGKYVAYVSNELGKYKVILYNLEDEKNKAILKGGIRTLTQATDGSVPLLAWSKTGKKLSIVNVKRDKIFLIHYNIVDGKKEKQPVRNFQKIYSISYAENDKYLLFSGLNKGQVDIYKYYITSSKKIQLTNDFYDDLNPVYMEINGKKGYMFASNRPTDTLRDAKLDSILPTGNFDLFFIDMVENDNLLARVTNTPHANEMYASQLSDEEYLFISDKNGINNQYAGTFEQTLAHHKIKYVYETEDYIDSVQLHENISLDSILYDEEHTILRTEKIPVYKYTGKNRPVSNYFQGVLNMSVSQRTNEQLVTALYEQKKKFYIVEMPDETQSINATDFMRGN